MKKILLLSLAIFGLLFAGCGAQKSVSVQSDTSVDGNKTGSGGSDNFDSAGLGGVDGNKVYFDFDKFNIRSDMQRVITAKAGELKANADAKVLIEGNCDEWGTDEYNQALGLKRANAVKQALVAQGIAAARIQVKSYGESNPVCSEKSKACDAQNRRAEFKAQ